MCGLAYALEFISELRERDPIDFAVMALEGSGTTDQPITAERNSEDRAQPAAAHSTHRALTGSASRRASGIGSPHRSQIP
jgi:hypothetical protein